MRPETKERAEEEVGDCELIAAVHGGAEFICVCRLSSGKRPAHGPGWSAYTT
jgi:hypothetical protein